MMNWVEANGTVLRCELVGEARGTTPLVLVHEMGGTLETWDGVMADLSRSRQVLRYDMRGQGFSERLRAPLTVDVLADDLAALLDRLRLSGKVAVAGNAVGGAVALHFAARHPQRVAALIAMGPSTFMPPERRPGALAQAEKLEREGQRAAVDRAQWPSAAASPDDAAEILRCRRLANDPHGVAGLWRMLADLDVSADFPRISCPTLVLAGTRDAVRPPALVETVARAIPGARFAAIDTGHVMAIDTPELVATTIGGYLAEIGI
jgi:pimeloyl-ACP methyl ester carboxylesterase